MQSIGERLEEARKRKGISIREAAESTKIRGEYLHKFESNQFDIKLPEIYVRGFLRTYANYLRLPGEKIINDYNALGLNSDPKSRSLHREVYGRMDLSVSSVKPDKDNKEPESQTVATAAPDDGPPRNPATFQPRPSLNISMDRGVVVKGSAVVAGLIVVILLVVWAFSGHGGSERSRTEMAAKSSTGIWIRPEPGKPFFTLIATGRVAVTVTYYDGTVFFQDSIPAGETRDIPQPGRPITINTEHPENLQLKIKDSVWPMQDSKTKALLYQAVLDKDATPAR